MAAAQIIDEYASRDSRVRVVHLDRNVDLGPAREIGLQHATGEYVWFLDSDDWLAPGSLRAVVRRLRAVQPDVLIVEHARVSWDPRVQPRPAIGDFLHEAPEVFTLREWPRALDILHVAWNKVVRRDLLTALRLPFRPAGTRTSPSPIQLLLAAERISRAGPGLRQLPAAPGRRRHPDPGRGALRHLRQLAAGLRRARRPTSRCGRCCSGG